MIRQKIVMTKIVMGTDWNVLPIVVSLMVTRGNSGSVTIRVGLSIVTVASTEILKGHEITSSG